MTTEPITSHVKIVDPHKCSHHGCTMRGSIMTTHEWVCTFHYGVKMKDSGAVTSRINRENFQKLYKLAAKFLTSVSNDHQIRKDQIAWLDGFVEFLPFKSKPWETSHIRLAHQIIALLCSYAHDGLNKKGDDEDKPKQISEWKNTMETLKSSINIAKDDFYDC